MKELAEKLVVDAVVIVKNHCKQLQKLMDANLVMNVFKMFDTFINEVKPNDFGVIEDWKLKLFVKYLDHFFLFALIWGIGGTIADEESR